MQLLIQRGQRRKKILQNPVFTLWAKFELTSEEAALINKYQVLNYVLVEGDPLQFKRAMLFAIPIAVLAYAVVVLKAGLIGGLVFGLFIFGMSTFIIFDFIREQVRIGDILDGRFFSCKSVVSLMAKEQNIAQMANAFRHLLEAMKNWGGKEIINLEPYKEPALRVIEGPHASA